MDDAGRINERPLIIANGQRERRNPSGAQRDDRSKAGAPVKRIERRAERVLVGRDAKMIAIVERLAPLAYPAILERLRGPA